MPDQWSFFFCLIDVGILSLNLVLLCTKWGSSSGLGHWWHLSPLQRQAGETALLALIPVLIIFKAAGIYITLTQAPVALQLPQETAFVASPSYILGIDCTQAPQKHLAS